MGIGCRRGRGGGEVSGGRGLRGWKWGGICAPFPVHKSVWGGGGGLVLRPPPIAFHCSAGSGVTAIDNKIEQALELVKSHVLLAVREEVELLREQLKALRERGAALERENGALRALATPQQLEAKGAWPVPEEADPTAAMSPPPSPPLPGGI
uniref:TSC22 domain family protein 4 n=1 Tax=Amazona collaria TaxID=241587 RepID=A0A8B9J0R6_9PSIT